MSADNTSADKTSTSGSGRYAGKKHIHTLKRDDSFIVSEDPRRGILLRENIVEGTTVASLSDAQIVSQALNEVCRKRYGIGKLFWIPSRQTRTKEKDAGMCSSGADLVYIPWVWSDVDNHLYDDATIYDRLKMTNAWTYLPPRTLVLSIYNNYKVKTTTESNLPRAKPGNWKYDFGTVSVLLLWDDFPHLAFRENVQGINLQAPGPCIRANYRRPHRISSLDLVVQKLHEMWKFKKPNGDYRRVSMEEVYADALIPGQRKNQTLARIIWNSNQPPAPHQVQRQSIAASSTTRCRGRRGESEGEDDDDDS